MKCKKGDKVRVVKMFNGHRFRIGEIVEIVQVYKKDLDYLVTGANNNEWWVTDSEIELID
mgnify:CR=1 FL=1